MKLSAFFMVLMTMISTGFSQVPLHKEFRYNEDTVFFGIQNRFKADAKMSVAKSITSENASIVVASDVLSVSPRRIGPITIDFIYDNDTQHVKVIAVPLPSLRPIIQSVRFTNEVQKDSVVSFAKVAVVEERKGKEALLGKYVVHEFTVRFREQLYVINGERLSAELLAAINKADPGDTISILNITAFIPME